MVASLASWYPVLYGWVNPYGEVDGAMTGTDFGGPIVGEWNALKSHSAHTALVKGSSGPKSELALRCW